MSNKQKPKPWTVGFDGRSNSSQEYLRIVGAVKTLLSGHRLDTPLNSTARLIVSQLAHVHRLAPQKRER